MSEVRLLVPLPDRSTNPAHGQADAAAGSAGSAILECLAPVPDWQEAAVAFIGGRDGELLERLGILAG